VRHPPRHERLLQRHIIPRIICSSRERTCEHACSIPGLRATPQADSNIVAPHGATNMSKDTVYLAQRSVAALVVVTKGSQATRKRDKRPNRIQSDR